MCSKCSEPIFAVLHSNEKLISVYPCHVGQLETSFYIPKFLRTYDYSVDLSYSFITNKRLLVEPEEVVRKDEKWGWWVSVQAAGFFY